MAIATGNGVRFGGDAARMAYGRCLANVEIGARKGNPMRQAMEQKHSDMHVLSRSGCHKTLALEMRGLSVLHEPWHGHGSKQVTLGR